MANKYATHFLSRSGKLKPSGVDYLETWEAMEEFVNEGIIRAIGLSNFSLKQLQRVLENCKIKPAVLQIETNAFWVNHSKEGKLLEGKRKKEHSKELVTMKEER